LYKIAESCEKAGIAIHGIIDRDYYKNTETICDIPVIDSQDCFGRAEKKDYYRSNFNFICVSNWNPEQDPVHVRNKQKRHELIGIIEHHQLPTITVIDQSSVISKHSSIGKNIYIECLSHVSPNAVIEDHCYIGSMTGISHHVHIHKNCVIQGDCRVLTDCVLHENTYFGTGVRALKPGSVFGKNTFIHEMVYIRRGTVDNEIVSLSGENPRRIYPVFEQ
jgi:bifunctional N-acetylglucosamine-1-phosphate-uridyltransferase/glucosamine-1-phosphate-acetyltransferase GlmU-like protein